MSTVLSPRDPAKCEREHRAWLQETERWRSDHRRALDTLQRTAEFIRGHEAELDRHEEAIRAHQSEIGARLQGGPGEGSESDERRLQEAHRRVLDEHNRFRGRHGSLVAEVLRLEVALHKASHSSPDRSAEGL
jgi:hypothetical protein